ncbi:UDP-N-acetylglucosamine 1-carboxyvinyltransferase [Streptomyces sp. ISL-43]|uniref:UDP-N-acetylglucosamine 1-carboxyvinyltransferase n=1 Tax=Streptomyces sp. ISL-43 TaxID=2819183 RepID=UPI001BE59904|nr:UDP-N-acetylglucosamine 1-carboxyvinyltransferase [Streptomyces sp. ISL-43]MBT2451061.1 UDP-N-acetylglucosamine 1-carboxyvinyltransferase [Streptomyces sp. ISL-43]
MAPTRALAPSTEVIAVRPGRPLSGSVTVDGSKNAALPLLATAAAVRRTIQLENVPASADVHWMLTLIQGAGWHVARAAGRPDSVVIMPPDAVPAELDLAPAARIRASYYLVPALLALQGNARLPWPGGCRIGERGMDLHFKVYEAFGDRITVRDEGYDVETGRPATGTVSHTLPFRSRGATVAAVLRAVVAGRALRLRRPNLSPEVLTVLDALRSVGWEARAGEQVLDLSPAAASPAEIPAWRVPGDKIEAGTLACAVAATGGTARIEGVQGRDVVPLQAALQRLGIPTAVREDVLLVDGSAARPTGRPLRAIATLATGGLDADFEPPLMALALGQPGTHLFADSINPGRHGNLLPQLARLGAKIEEISPTKCRLTGPQRLTGAGVEATDIRTGSALMVAALTARGITTLGGVDQLRRGHADLPGKLLHLGADICEVAP